MASNSILINGSILYEIPDSKMGIVDEALVITKETPLVFTGRTCSVERNKIGERRDCCKTVEIN